MCKDDEKYILFNGVAIGPLKVSADLSLCGGGLGIRISYTWSLLVEVFLGPLCIFFGWQTKNQREKRYGRQR